MSSNYTILMNGDQLLIPRFLEKVENKISDQDFLRDMEGLLRPGLSYKITEAYEYVKTELLIKIIKTIKNIVIELYESLKRRKDS